MALARNPSGSVETLSEIIEFNQNPLSHNDVNQDMESLGQSCGQSSSPLDLQNQRNDLGARMNDALASSSQEQYHVDIVPNLPQNVCNRNPSLTGDMIMQNSGDSTPTQGPDLNAVCADSNNNEAVYAGSDESGAEPRLSMDSSSNSVDHSLGIRVQQDDSSSGSTTTSGLSGERRTVHGNSRQVFEAGSSSGPEQEDGSTWNTHSVHLSASSSTRLSISPLNPSPINFQEHHVLRTRDDLRANSTLLPHLSTNVYPGRHSGNYNPGIDMGSRHNSMPFDSLATMNAPLHFGPHQSFRPVWLNEPSVGSSIPYMSEMDPSLSRNVTPLPSTNNSNSRAGISTERIHASDPGNLLQQSRQYSPAIGNVGALGGASTSQTEYGSGFHQRSALPWATHSIGRRQTASELSPWLISPQDASGSEAHNYNNAPGPAINSYGSIRHLWRQPGPRNMGYRPYSPGPQISQSRHHLMRPEMPLALQAMEAQTDEGPGMTWEEQFARSASEIRQFINAANASANPQAQIDQFLHAANVNANPQAQGMFVHQNHLPINMFQNPWISQDRHRDMMLDVENMSYEELIELGEQIGSVNSGLTEETIMELLKRRDYGCGTSKASADETCCICREEYVAGDEIGTLNCSHEFHTGCIKQWLIIKNQCPICKTEGVDR